MRGLSRLLGSAVEEAADGATLAKLSGILRDAASGKGNFGLGEATAAEAEELGNA